MKNEEKKNNKYRMQWLLRGGFGAVLFGSGLSATIEVAFMRYEGAPFWKWFLLGTLSLAILITGLNFIVDAVRFKIKMREVDNFPRD